MPTAREQKIQKMRDAGIPIPITQMNEGAIPVTAKNADKHARLAALKSGANRQVVQSLVKSKGAQNGFQGIPEPTKKRAPQGHPSNQVTPGKSVPLKSFEPPKDQGLSAIEAMYSSGGGEAYAQPQAINMNAPQTNTTQPDLTVNEDGYGPAFDPRGMLAQKKADMQKNNDYLKFAQEQPQQPQQEVVPGQQQFDFKYMQKMMEEVAKNTISDVLNSYTEKNKNKLTYENYTKSKDGSQIIKTQDGSFYKLTPVRFKKD